MFDAGVVSKDDDAMEIVVAPAALTHILPLVVVIVAVDVMVPLVAPTNTSPAMMITLHVGDTRFALPLTAAAELEPAALVPDWM